MPRSFSDTTSCNAFWFPAQRKNPWNSVSCVSRIRFRYCLWPVDSSKTRSIMMTACFIAQFFGVDSKPVLFLFVFLLFCSGYVYSHDVVLTWLCPNVAGYKTALAYSILVYFCWCFLVGVRIYKNQSLQDHESSRLPRTIHCTSSLFASFPC